MAEDGVKKAGEVVKEGVAEVKEAIPADAGEAKKMVEDGLEKAGEVVKEGLDKVEIASPDAEAVVEVEENDLM